MLNFKKFFITICNICVIPPPLWGAIILITDTLIPVFNFLNKYRIFIFMYCFY